MSRYSLSGTTTTRAGGSTDSSTTRPTTDAPDDGPILRYDNAHDDDLGKHHRHIRPGEDTEIEFHGIVPHVARFLTEVGELAENDTDTENTNP